MEAKLFAKICPFLARIELTLFYLVVTVLQKEVHCYNGSKVAQTKQKQTNQKDNQTPPSLRTS